MPTCDIGFLGGGKMASAIRDGISDRNETLSIGVHDPVLSSGDTWGNSAHTVFPTAKDLFENSKWLIWAIKPQVFYSEFETWKDLSFEGEAWISIMAGVNLKSLESIDEKVPVIRTMPNTPMMLNKGVVAICKGTRASDEHLKKVEWLFEKIAWTLTLPEESMDGVTALSGSGPAYCFYLAEEVQRRAAELGLSPDQARDLWAHTMAGSAEMLTRSGQSPAELRVQVTSPGGTTQAAIESLDSQGVADAFGEALLAAKNRSIELSHN